MTCGGFADDEGLYSGRWKAVKDILKDFLFRWQSGCTEEQSIRLVPDERLRELIEDPLKDKTGERLRTLAIRCNQSDKDFDSLKAACTDLRSIIIEAATGAVPQNIELEPSQKKEYQKHRQCWFKSVEGGKELFDKVTQFGLWPNLKDELLPLVNAARSVANLPIIADLS